MARWRRALESEPPVTAALLDHVKDFARPLHDEDDLAPLVTAIGAKPYVLLGEASHGTAEYYAWRARLTRRLIEAGDVSFVAVEGDWPDCYQVNRFVKALPGAAPDARSALGAFRRWPTWMWANEEVMDFITWLRHHNDGVAAERKVGFYGLDVYSLWDSIASLGQLLSRHDPEAHRLLRQVVECFEPYGASTVSYARASAFQGPTCERMVCELTAHLTRNLGTAFDDRDHEAHFRAAQNAWVVRNAEAYYRAMVAAGPDSWNIRDTHMADTMDRLMAFHGPRARCVVWEHNTHVGDARFTDMRAGGMVNLGQLARERHGEDAAFLVGFGGFRGSVIAGEEWDAPWQPMPVPPGRPGSWEAVLHEVAPARKLLIMSEAKPTEELRQSRGHRAIGVVYDPAHEAWGNYVPTTLPRRYDAFLSFDGTEAVHPLAMRPAWNPDVPETFPSAQ